MNSLLSTTMSNNATDLHLCAGSKPIMRISSKLVPIEGEERLDPILLKKIAHHYLDDAKYDQLLKYKSVDLSYSKQNFGRFRCNFYLQRGSIACAIRSLPLQIPDIGTLGLPENCGSLLNKSKGLILIAGATGSGKSTTLASMIQQLNSNYSYHITTIEDPVEFLHRHDKSLVTQKEIGPDALNFASALRASLREDPDVIMLGEMRDYESISIALTAAETGHLVLSTIHTNGAVKAIDRILDSFPTEQHAQTRSQLASVLEGIISQQLVPKKDGSGLVLASELLIVTPAVRNLIREGKHYQIKNLIQNGANSGMQSIERCLSQLYKNGVIEYEEAKLRANDHQLLETYCKV
ncbi:MAG: type IV pili twitching motility protein PilT [Clostridiales bacterium]|nr:MAG: type IV pili twitching motility protein PilT [Clostridiales bacterium]